MKERELERTTEEAWATGQSEVVGDEYGIQSEGSSSSFSYFIPARTLLRTALRPRVVGKGNNRNWEETFSRLSLVYDILLSHAEISDTGEFQGEGKFSAVLDPDHPTLDLVEEFYSIFPEARSASSEESPEGIPKRALRPNILLVKDSRLLAFLETLKDYFGLLVEGTRFDYDPRKELPELFPSEEETRTKKGGRSRSPSFVRLQEAVSLASRSLGENLPEADYESILREVLEAYLSYAENIRALPKPEFYE